MALHFPILDNLSFWKSQHEVTAIKSIVNEVVEMLVVFSQHRKFSLYNDFHILFEPGENYGNKIGYQQLRPHEDQFSIKNFSSLTPLLPDDQSIFRSHSFTRSDRFYRVNFNGDYICLHSARIPIVSFTS